MRKSHLILVHVCYWLYIFVFSEIMNKLAYQNKFVDVRKFFEPLALTNYLIFGLIFYINYLVVLPRLFVRKRYFLTLACWLTLVFLFVTLRYFVQEVFLLDYFGLCNYCGENINIYIANNSFQGFNFLILAGTVIWFIDNWLKVKRQQFILQQEKLVAERAFLQLQVSPHFLFNTLNNIYSMVFHRSPKALPAIQILADLMRYAVREYKEEKVDLVTEVSYLRNYIELQRLRIVNDAIEYKETGDFGKGKIPPMLLISFVENAFKHGVINDASTPLVIHINSENGNLQLFIKNKINQNRKDMSPGVGQGNVKKRLDAYYGNKYKLSINEDGNYYYSSLNLPY